MEKALLCWSGGKDSALALDEIQKSQEYEIAGLLVTISEEYDRVSMHGVPRSLVEQQAGSLGLPVKEVFIPSPSSMQEYESRMERALAGFQQEGVASAVFGDIFLEDLRKYREDNLSKLGMKGVFPLWGRDTAELVRYFITSGFRAVVTCVDSRVLDKGFIGRTIDEDFLAELPSGVDPCGENGEYHSFVYDGPIFEQPIAVTMGETVQRDSFYFCDLVLIQD
jgi:uncharacterized protein (TIGR00290 family)